MNKLKKFCIYDFCGTVVELQTADRFVSYVLLKEGRFFSYTLALILDSWFYKFVKFNILKSKSNDKFFLLNLLRGIEKKKILKHSATFAELLQKYGIQNICNQLKKDIDDKLSTVIVISAGYEPYIKEFIKNKAIVIANNFLYENDVFKGKIIGNDCYGQEKVKRLSELIPLKNIDYNQTCVYSDSMTDKPIFMLGKNKFFVDKELIRKINIE